jgi:fumarate hydratase class II
MPGKVNPVIAESVTMARAARVLTRRAGLA